MEDSSGIAFASKLQFVMMEGCNGMAIEDRGFELNYNWGWLVLIELQLVVEELKLRVELHY
jgi:hypothetical protein